MTSISTDLEKGPERPGDTNYSVKELPHDGPSPTAVPSVHRDPQTQQILTEFRHCVGIHNDPDLAGGRAVANLGIYQRIVKQEQTYKKQFSVFSWLINSALGLQIIIAAALTALGAGNGPRSAVTVFGALNTIIAGFLTYLKGSGLPNRLKYYKEELTKVREYIEQREREFSRGDINVDLKTEVMIIEEMYGAVRRDIEVNTPEAFVSRAKESTRNAPASIDHLASRARREYDDRLSYIDEKVHSTRRGLESRLSEARVGAETRYRDVRSGLDDRLGNARYGLESRLSQERLGMESRLSDARHGLESQYQQTRTGLESQANNTRLAAASQLENTRHGLESQYQQTRAGVENQVNNTRLATASQLENTRHGLEARIEDARTGAATQFEEARHGMEGRLKEVQQQVKEHDKIMNIAGTVAQKVLAATQSRHGHDHDQT